jgi:hypothetical protein
VLALAGDALLQHGLFLAQLRLLEDIQHRLSSLGEDGAQAVGRGMSSLGDIHLDRSFDTITRKVKSLFH